MRKVAETLSAPVLARILDYGEVSRSCSITPEAMSLWVGNVRQYLTRYGIVQRELAARCGLTHVYLCYALGGRRKPSLKNQVAIAVALGLPPDDLYLPHREFMRRYT